MRGKRVLITGASGLIGFDLSRELCKTNQVYGLARFTDASIRRELEALGVTCILRYYYSYSPRGGLPYTLAEHAL